MPLGKPISSYGEVVPYDAGAEALAMGSRRILAYRRSVPERLRVDFRYVRARGPCRGGHT